MSLVPCNVNPCMASNTDCTNTAGTRSCSCSLGHVPTDGSNPDNGCGCK